MAGFDVLLDFFIIWLASNCVRFVCVSENKVTNPSVIRASVRNIWPFWSWIVDSISPQGEKKLKNLKFWGVDTSELPQQNEVSTLIFDTKDHARKQSLRQFEDGIDELLQKKVVVRKLDNRTKYGGYFATVGGFVATAADLFLTGGLTTLGFVGLSFAAAGSGLILPAELDKRTWLRWCYIAQKMKEDLIREWLRLK